MTGMFQSRLQRRVAGGVLVAALCAVSALGMRGAQKPLVEKAPDFRQKGPPAAKIVIAEFSDFQCPACRVAEPTVRQIMDLYKDEARLVFKDFPLERIHPFARMAATAAECAGKQGKFWPLHDELYDKQPGWVEAADPKAAVLGYAKGLGLDAAALQSCMDDPATKAEIDADVKEANDRFVYSTPTFFVNGRRFVGKGQLASLGVHWIDKQLGRAK